MKKGKVLEDLIEDIEVFIPSLVSNKQEFENASKHLSERHNISRSLFATVINNPKQLEVYGELFTGVIAQQIGEKVPLANEELLLSNWFTEFEITKIESYQFENEESDEISFPLVLQNAEMIKPNVYQVAIPETMIARMRKYYLLKYNFDLQRDPMLITRGGKIRKKMNIVKKNIEEIEELVLKGELMPTAVVYNCTPYTGVGGEELIYNEKTRELTINEGTIMNILDGTHRTFGIYSAYRKDRNLKNKITTIITNFTDEQAKRFQVQLSKQTPINTARLHQLDAPTLANHIVNALNVSDIFKDKVATNPNRPRDSYFVHYDEFVTGFEVLWQAETMLDVKDIVSDFSDYLMYLLDYHTKNKTNKDSYMMDSKLFVGHIALAKKMKEQSIPYRDLPDILSMTDWSNNNEELVKLKEDVSKSNFKLTKKNALVVGKYFETLI